MKKTLSYVWRMTALTVLLAMSMSVRAEINSGSVYRIVNHAYGTAISEDYVNSRAKCLTVGDDTAYEQLWVVTKKTGTAYTFQNVFTGHYMTGAGTGQSAYYPTGTTAAQFNVTPNAYDGSAYDIKGSSHWWHCASSQGDYVVGWYAWTGSENEASAWLFEEVPSVTEAAIAAARDEFATISGAMKNASAYDKALKTFFADEACTELQGTYAAMGDDELRSALADAGLPAELQEMAVKVKNDGWADHEERFRVRDYKPYSNPVNWQQYTKQNYQSWMNQPTGIGTQPRSVLYVMVDGDVPKNATLYINGYASGWTGSGTEGTQLHKGLNVVLTANPDEMLYVFYTADTWHGGAKDRLLSEFPDIRIHIEGGTLNGFWSKGDTPDDWRWYERNAKLTRFLLVGEYCIWNMPGEYAFRHLKADGVAKSMAMYDWLIKWELAMQGLITDYDDVEYGTTITKTFIDGTSQPECNVMPSKYNNKAFAYSDDTGYMDATNYRAHFNNNTLGTILPYDNIIQGGGYFWGPAHEFGHQNQGAINMPGCTEVSNNLLSEVVNFMVGYSDSRGSSTDVLMDDFSAGRNFYQRDIWQMCRMYYQLFLYYHATGIDPTFYPRLFEALRKDPLVFGGGCGDESARPEATLGEKMHMKFALKCCEIAQEDLTDFFEAYGFFMPMDYQYVGDYTSRRVTSTQARIDEVKAKIKAHGYPVNSRVMLLEDRIGDVPKGALAAAEGKTGYKAFYGDAGYAQDDKKLPQYGQYTDVLSDKPATGYSFVQNGGKLVISGGQNALGFTVYDETGTLIAFSTTGTVTLPSDFTGNTVEVHAMNGIGCTEPWEKVSGTYDAGQSNLALLNGVLEEASAVCALKDVDGIHPGWFSAEALTTLEALVAEAKEVISQADASRYIEFIDALRAELDVLKADTSHRTPLLTGHYYALENAMYPGYAASYNAGNVKNTTGALTADAKKWGFVPAGADGEYYIFAKGRHYVGSVSRSTQVATVADMASAAVFALGDNGDGTFYIQEVGDDNNYKSLHCDAAKNMVGWSTDALASHWTITLTETVDNAALRDKLYDLSAEVISFADAAITVGGAIKLQTTSPTAKGYVTTNAQEKSEGPIANLVDGNTGNFFHSSWQSSTDDYHYIQVDLGQGVTLAEFTFSYTMRSGDVINAPTVIDITGSNNGRDFTPITTLTKKDATNPLPTTAAKSTYNSSAIVCPEPYRYFRFTVKETVNNRSAGNCGYPYFSMAEFSMATTATATVINPGFEGLSISDVEAIAEQARTAIALSSRDGATDVELQAAYQALLDAYYALLDAIGNLTGHVVTLTNKAYNTRRVTERLDGSYANSVYGLPATDAATPGEAAQQWVIHQKGDQYTLQNVYTGRYLKHSTKNDVAWTTVSAAAAASSFYLYKNGDYISFDYVSADGKGDKSGMHCGGQNGYRICHWTTNVDPSLWRMNDVTTLSEADAYAIAVLIEGKPTVTCDIALTGHKVMDGGLFYVPKGTVLQPSDFSVSPAPTEGGIDVSIDSAAGTVTISVATAIDVIPAAEPAAHAVYDLYGRRVLDAAPDLHRLNGTLPHGLYIIDGRKVLVR